MKKKGITLIALIITIVVLLILAGVTISFVVGDNGVVTQAQKSKTKTEKARFVEDAELAYSEIYAEKTNDINFTDVTISEVVEKLESEYEYKIEGIPSGIETNIELKDKIGVIEGKEKTVSVLKGDEMEYYANIKGAYYPIELAKPDVKLGEPIDELPTSRMELTMETPLSYPEGCGATVAIDGTSLDIKGIKKGDTRVTVKLKANGKETTGTINIGVYKDNGSLKDVADIGDYVDIGLDYKNVQGFSSNYTTTKTALTGWRVLNIDGEKDVIQLVSAGCPLRYYHEYSTFKSIPLLEDLYTTIQLNGSHSISGFTKSGFGEDEVSESQDLTEIFDKCEYIKTETKEDGTKWKQIHALGCGSHYNGYGADANEYEKKDEVETLYNLITKKSKTMSELVYQKEKSNYDFRTMNIKELATDSNWKESYTDLLCNGMLYCLGGSSFDGNYLWTVEGSGSLHNYTISYFTQPNFGVRPVITLKSGIQIDTENTGSGLKSDSALMIKL